MQTIFRLLKLKGSNITASDEHCRRLSPVENADPAKKHLNYEFASGGTEIDNFAKGITLVERMNYQEKARGIITPRKDSVKMLEIMFAAPPSLIEKPEEQIRFSNGKAKHPEVDSLLWRWNEANNQFLSNTFGRENIMGTQMHFDETSPHSHSWILPIKKEKFGVEKYNAKHFTGGAKKMQQLQDKYYEHMQKYMPEIAWERGQKKELTGKKHTTVKEWYGKKTIHEKHQKEIDGLGIGDAVERAIKAAVEAEIKKAKENQGLIVGTGKGAQTALNDLHNHPVKPQPKFDTKKKPDPESEKPKLSEPEPPKKTRRPKIG
jgi:hypothetical protein